MADDIDTLHCIFVGLLGSSAYHCKEYIQYDLSYFL